MNSFVTTNDVPAFDMAKRLRVGKLLILAVGISLLAACAELPKRTPPPKPIVTTTPSPKPPVSAPVQPTASGVVFVAPANHEQEKKRIKSLLSKSPRDSLPVSEVGYYMDVLQGRVKQKIGKTKGIGMARNDDLIVIVMRGSAGFEAGNTKISPGIRQFLAPLAKVLVEYRMTLVSVRIRSDDSGVNNSQLADQRAQAVARYLVDAGVSSKHMIVVGDGKGSAAPKNPGSTSSERIELQIEPVVRQAGE